MSVQVLVDGQVVYQEPDRLRQVLHSLQQIEHHNQHLYEVLERQGFIMAGTLQTLQQGISDVASGVEQLATDIADLKAKGVGVMTQDDLDALDASVQTVKGRIATVHTPDEAAPSAFGNG